MKRIALVLIIVLLLSTQVFPRLFVLVRKPQFKDNGVVCTMELEQGPFDQNLPMTDEGGNWTIVDSNGIRINNQMRVEMEQGLLFDIADYDNFDSNDANLYGEVRIMSYNDLSVGTYSFILRIYDIEDNNSINMYQVNVHDRTPPIGGCE